MKFKVGDKVRFIKEGSIVPNGLRGIVTKIARKNPLILEIKISSPVDQRTHFYTWAGNIRKDQLPEWEI